MTETQPAKLLLQRPGFWAALGVVLLAGAVLILLGPAIQPRSEVSDLVNALIGPGMAIFSIGAGLAFRRASRLAEARWATLTTTSVAWAAFAFGGLMIVATLSS